jgi:hypothetical protein
MLNLSVGGMIEKSQLSNITQTVQAYVEDMTGTT